MQVLVRMPGSESVCVLERYRSRSLLRIRSLNYRVNVGGQRAFDGES